MNDPQDQSAAGDVSKDQFVQLWSEYARQANVMANMLLQDAERIAQPQEWRRRWLEVLAHCVDAHMRTPTFLHGMKHQLQSMIQRLPSEVTTSRVTSVTDRFATPSEVVYQEGTLRLLRYRSEQTSDRREPVLICFALVNRPYILDLLAERSVVRQLLKQGFDVYLIDWGIPTEADRTLRLGDYICRLMNNAAGWIRKSVRCPQFHLLGNCMGGTMSAMFTSLYPQWVRSLTVMAAPIDFRGDESLLNIWTREENFDVDELIDAWGNCPGSLLQVMFQLTRPVQNFYEKYSGLAERIDDAKYCESFRAVETWIGDSVPVAGETFRDFIKFLYQQNRLVRGEMYLDDVCVELRNIICPVLMLTADDDHLVPARSTLALRNYVRSTEVQHMTVRAGHIGLAVSSRAHATLWPAAAQWMADLSQT